MTSRSSEKPRGLVLDGPHIRVGNLNRNTVAEVGAHDGDLMASYDTPTPQATAFDGAGLWIACVADGTLRTLR